MKQDIDSLKDAWRGLADLTASMACGCRIEEDDVYTIYLVAGKCKQFLEEFAKYHNRPL